MKYLFILSGVVCLSFMLLPACAPEPVQEAEPEPETVPEAVFDQSAEEAAVRKAEEKFNAAWNAHDAKAVAATYVESAENWDGSMKGKGVIEKGLGMAFAGPWKNLRSAWLEEIGVVFVTPEVAILKGIYEWGGTVDKAGNEVPATRNLYARVYVKRNGEWLGYGYFSRPIEE